MGEDKNTNKCPDTDSQVTEKHLEKCASCKWRRDHKVIMRKILFSTLFIFILFGAFTALLLSILSGVS